MTTYFCLYCDQPFTGHPADRKRGWAKFCSKSCKAKEQERRTHQFANMKNRKMAAHDGEGVEDEFYSMES